MTSASALRGRGIGSKAVDSTDRLREWDSDKRGGVKNPKFLRTSYMNGPYVGNIRPVCAVEGKTERKRRRGNGMASWSEGGIE